jgi:hypothetical protein
LRSGLLEVGRRLASQEINQTLLLTLGWLGVDKLSQHLVFLIIVIGDSIGIGNSALFANRTRIVVWHSVAGRWFRLWLATGALR